MTTLQDVRPGEASSPVDRWEANMQALHILKDLEEQGREATPEERAALKRFAGFGDSSFSRAFHLTADPDQAGQDGLQLYRSDAWAQRGDELRELASDDEYSSIRNARTTAFYTTPQVVDAMWDGVEGMGVGNLQTLKVLEPSAGSGRFIQRQPPALRERSNWTAVEKDALTARMLRHSFDDVNVRHAPLEETLLPDDAYDLAISNVPFGSQGVHDPEYLRSGKAHMTRSLHNYFFGKSLDKVRPGGIVAFVTSHYMMDSPRAQGVRATLAEEADLVGAVRLPRGTFPDTDVVTDIVYLRKRLPGEEPGDQGWVKTTKVDVEGVEHPVNNYFVENPSQVLGTARTMRGMRAPNEYVVMPDEAAPLTESLLPATARALREAPAIAPASTVTPSPVRTAAPARKSTPRVSAEDKPLVKSLAAVRDLARQQVDMESGGGPDAEIEANRERLQGAYREHVESYGALNTPRNYALMGEDLDRALLFSLEVYDKETDCWRPADIMGVRTVSAGSAQPQLQGPSDALDYHMQMSGALDFNAVGELIGQDGETVRDSLAVAGRVYRLPQGGWETSDRYLSGNVREKLELAERAAAGDPSFRANVEALREVQPPWIGGEDIAVPMGSPWVPDRYVNQWITEQLGIRTYGGGDDQFFAYEPDFGRWRQRRQFPKDFRTQDANRAMGTPKVPAQKIIEKMLTGGSLQIGKEMTAEDVRFAQQRANELQDNWEEWLWSDHDRAAELEHRYNHTFNEYRPRTYRGKEFYPGMDVKWQRDLHPFQREAIQRVVSDGTTLLAHEVGFGKTATMIGSAMERQRLGLTEKPLFVIPKATHAQFQDQFMELYPGAQILAPEEGEFSAANRERFLSRIATNDWDAVILTGEQFQAIPLSPAKERAFVAAEMAQLQAALETLEADPSQSEGRAEGTRSMSQKAVDTAIASTEKRLRDRLAKIARDDAVYFDQLGVDMLYVDEADRYKNLQFRTGMGGRGDNIKGMPSGESSRALDMYNKIRYLQGLDDPGEVVFATGTPISNTLAEAWTMQRYLNEPELRRQGLHHFDAWAKTFGDVGEDMELDAAGRYKMTKRFRDFVNKPELARMFQEVADIRVASETPSIAALRPRLAGGERHIVTSPRDPQMDAFMKVLNYRANNLPFPPQKGDDNMLKVLTDGRKASMDLRLVEDDEGYGPMFDARMGEEARPFREGKLVQVARNVSRIHEAEAPVKGAQLVFLDMGTPKAVKGDDDRGDSKAETEVAAAEAAVESGLYRLLKERMVDQGVPAEQIAFIHDYPSDDAREDLFDAVKKGDIRVVIGSTEKMGVGVNVQNRAAALHHVDAPWRPRDIEQREGRIVRQGNKVYGPILDADKNPVDPGRGVQIYQYVQKGGLDEFMWQLLEEKGRGIKGIMKRHIDPGERRVQDIDSLVLTAADTKAAAAANPLVKRNVELGHAIKDLQSDRKAHQLRTKTAQQDVGALQATIETARAALPRLERDAAHVSGLPKDEKKFQATVGGRSYDKSTEAGEALAGAVVKLPMDLADAPPAPLGQFKGFEVVGNRLESGYSVALARPDGQPHWIHFGSKEDIVPEGIMRRLNNQIAGIPERTVQTRDRLETSERRLESAQRESALRWDRAPELQALQAEQSSIQARLKAGETGEEANVSYGLQPSPVGPWTPSQVAAVERQVAGEATAPAAAPAAVVAEPPAPPRPPAPPEEPKPVSAETEPAPEPERPKLTIRTMTGSSDYDTFRRLLKRRIADSDESVAQAEDPTESQGNQYFYIGQSIREALHDSVDQERNPDEYAELVALHDEVEKKREAWTAAAEPIKEERRKERREQAKKDWAEITAPLRDPSPPTPAPEPEATPPSPEDLRAAQLAAITDKDLVSFLKSAQVRHEVVAGRKGTKNATRRYAKEIEEYEGEIARRGLQPDTPAEPPPASPAEPPTPEPGQEFSRENSASDLQTAPAPASKPEPVYVDVAAQPPQPLTPVAKPEPPTSEPGQEFSREKADERSTPIKVSSVHKVLAAVKEDRAYQNAMANSDEQNARIEHDAAFDRAVGRLVTEDPKAHAGLYKAYADREPFRQTILDNSFKDSYKPRPPAPRVEPDMQPVPADSDMSPLGLPKEYHRRVGAGLAVEAAREQLNRLRIQREGLETRIRRAESPDEQDRDFWRNEVSNYKEMLSELEAKPPKEKRRASFQQQLTRVQKRIETGEERLADMEAGADQVAAWRREISRVEADEQELQPALQQAREKEREAVHTEKAAAEARRASQEAAPPAPPEIEDLGGTPPDGASVAGQRAAEPAEPEPSPEWTYIDRVMEQKRHVFEPNDRMRYHIGERGDRWEHHLWVQGDDGRWAAGYYPAAGMYDSLEEAQDAAAAHYRDWKASEEPPPPVQLWASSGPFGGGRRMSLEEIRQAEADAEVRQTEQAKKDARNQKRKAKRDAERPHKLAANWREPGPWMSEKDLRRNLATLRGIEEAMFPPGEKAGIVATWEQALATKEADAAPPVVEPPADAAPASTPDVPKAVSDMPKPERSRDKRRAQREALRQEIEDLGGAPPDGASVKELTALRDRLADKSEADQPDAGPPAVDAENVSAPEPEPPGESIAQAFEIRQAERAERLTNAKAKAAERAAKRKSAPADSPSGKAPAKEPVKEPPAPKVRQAARKTAKQVAKKTAKQVAKETAEKVAAETATVVAAETALEVIGETSKPKKRTPSTAPDGKEKAKPAEKTHFLPPSILAKVRRKGAKPPKPVYPKVGTGKKQPKAASAPGFDPPRLPGQRRKKLAK